MRRPQKIRVLAPVHPNAGMREDMRKALEALVDQMQASYAYWIGVRWQEGPPTDIAMDETWQGRLIRTLDELGRRWSEKFGDLFDRYQDNFITKPAGYATTRLAGILNDAGWTVKFRPTPAVRTVMATAAEETSMLIRSIPEEYHAKIAGAVLRAGQAGRDLEGLQRELFAHVPKAAISLHTWREKAAGRPATTLKKRVRLIVMHQSNALTAAVTKARQDEAGIAQAVWMHSSAGREPRREHVLFAAGKWTGSAGPGPLYDPAEGVDFENGEGVVWPGTAINCRCTSRPVIPAFETGPAQTTPTALFNKAIARAK